MGLKVNDKIYRRRIKKLQKYVKTRLPKMSLKEFQDNTPVDKGYARRNTKLTMKNDGFKITGDYDYSGVIDRGEYPKNPVSQTGKTRNGFSTQSPKGMTEPTLDFVDKEIRKFIKRIR